MCRYVQFRSYFLNFLLVFNPLNPQLNPICYLLALLGAHHFLQVSRIRVKSLTFRLLISYIYGAPILDVSRSHTTTHRGRQDSSGRVISSSQRSLPDSTRHSQQTNIHAPGGIRTHDLSRRVAACRSPAEILGSNPTGGMDICLLWVSCVVSQRSLRRADHSSRGVLPTVLRRCV